jgi:hypothetical protein
MRLYENTKIKVKLTSKEIMEYNGYLSKLKAATSVVEVDTYYRLAQHLLDKAVTRQKGKMIN